MIGRSCILIILILLGDKGLISISPAALTQSLTALVHRNPLNLQANTKSLMKLKKTVLRYCFTRRLEYLEVSCITSRPSSKTSSASSALIRKENKSTPPKYNRISGKVGFL